MTIFKKLILLIGFPLLAYGALTQVPTPMQTITGQSKSANYTVLPADDYLVATAGLKFTLPAASTIKNLKFRNLSTTGTGTVATAGTDLINTANTTNGTTSVLLPKYGDAIELQADGSTSWNIINYFRAPLRTTLTSGAAQTFTTSFGVKYIVVEMWGAGGGGGASGTSGGGASVVGGTGTFGTATAAGGSGGGTGPNGGLAGNGGAASGCDFSSVGAVGMNGYFSPSAGSASGGSGGATLLGGNGQGGNAAGAVYTGTAGQGNSGSGGGGAASATASASTGGGGAAGAYCRFTIYNPATSYTYNVPSGGNGGTLGTNGAAGGNGGSGLTIVTEYF